MLQGYAAINGAHLAYEQLGNGGRDILFVHGYLSRATGEGPYSRLKMALAESNRLHCLDMRGHGGSSDVADKVTLDQCVQDIITYAKQIKSGRLYFAGHSMGGFLGLSAAIQCPDLFSGIALFAPSVSRGQPADDNLVNLVVAARHAPDVLDSFNRSMFVREVPQSVLEKVREDSFLFSADHQVRWMKEEWPLTDIAGGLSTLNTPVLYMIGLRDILVDPVQQQKDATRLPDAKAMVLTREGHLMPFEAPDLCALETLRFLEDIERREVVESRS